MPRPPAQTIAIPATLSTATRTAAVFLCLGLVFSGVAVDPFALASFDAPKRALALLCIVMAALCLLHTPWRWAWSRLPMEAKVSAGSLAFVVVMAVLAAVLSAHPPSAWDDLRTALLWLLLLPLGASAVLANPGWRRRIFVVAVWVIAGNALYSLLQWSQLGPQLPLLAQSGRFPSGALLGNEGYVALACALLGAASLALLLHPATTRWRWPAGLLLVLAVLTILCNQQLTAAVALGAAAAVLLGLRIAQRWVLPLGAGLVLLLGSSALFAPLRAHSWAKLPLSVEDYQARSTSRIAAWAAAVQLIEQRPWIGHGPGRYAALAQAARQSAELQYQQRLLPPVTANAFVQAHQEYLQLAAEIGIPALLAALLALALLSRELSLRALRDREDAEPLVLLGVLLAGAVAALAWFPLQIPLTASVLLMALGRSWRLLAGRVEAPAEAQK